jgi:serine/threonine protein phosphatase 1
MKANLWLDKNTKGTDYVVGDIHGCLKKLLFGLSRIGFDRETDRLLCVGDLIDRGEDSYGVVKLLDEPWFFSVPGNHELMCIDAYKWPSFSAGDFRVNGGEWFYELDCRLQDEVILRLSSLPLTIFTNVDTVDGEGNVLVVHARVPHDDGWSMHLRKDVEWDTIPFDYIQEAVWSRCMVLSTLNDEVEGLDVVCVGHTPQEHPKRVKNYLCLDTGVVFDEHKDFVFYNTKTKQIV